MNPLYILAIIVLSAVYVWTLHQIPILAIGVRHLRRSSIRTKKAFSIGKEDLPTVSIIVPAKDEEKVVDRLLKALLWLDYPPEKERS